MALGDGFAQALKAEMSGGSGELAAMFGRLFDQMAEDVYRRLREDVIAEVRAEVQRVEGAEMTDRLCVALERMSAPVVHVAPAAVSFAPTIEASPVDVEVKVPKVDAPKVTVEPRKNIRIIRNDAGEITGAEVS